MKVKTEIQCQGCKEKTWVIFRKPDYFTPSMGTFQCSCCDSKVQYRITKQKNENALMIKNRVVEVSKKLQEHLDELAAESSNS